MLNNDYFFFDLLRKYKVLFGTLFNDIYIQRNDAEGGIAQIIKVPISYAPKEKVLARIDVDPNIDRKASLSLPRLTFEMTGMRYDSERQLPPATKTYVRHPTDASSLKRQFTPIPYNFFFSLYVYVKNEEDGAKIMEQIMPFFSPSFSPTVELIEEMNEIKDIPITLDSVDYQDTYGENYELRRMILYTLNFSMKGYFYGPVKTSGLIKLVTVNFFIPTDDDLHDAVGVTDVAEYITIRPGLTANGEPTSNVAESIPLANINANDNYGYIITITNPNE